MTTVSEAAMKRVRWSEILKHPEGLLVQRLKAPSHDENKDY